jgi:hypothetical protein
LEACSADREEKVTTLWSLYKGYIAAALGAMAAATYFCILVEQPAATIFVTLSIFIMIVALVIVTLRHEGVSVSFLVSGHPLVWPLIVLGVLLGVFLVLYRLALLGERGEADAQPKRSSGQ